MELLNKIIYCINYINKVGNFDEKNYYINKFIVEKLLIIEYEFNNVVNFEYMKLLHFENKVDDKELIKIKN